VVTAHGPLPLPAPAVLEIARRCAIPLADCGDFPAGELTTPTGLALAACWAAAFGPAPTHTPEAVGVGLGQRQLDRPNLLRLVLARAGATGDPGESQEPLLQQQAQIDDATAEDLAFLAEALRQAGAVEVFSQAIAMKKGRAGTLITALLPPERAASLRQVWWRHSTSLGVREQRQERWILPREIVTVAPPRGPVRLKRTPLPGGGERLKAEHGDLAALAREHNLSLRQVRELVDQARRGER
jgi:uncharacterized protein (DUF111 family)